MQSVGQQIAPNQQQVNQQQQSSANKPRFNANAVPEISYSPTDITIPPSLYDQVPNLAEYKKLSDAENKLDLLISRKALDFQAIQQKTIHPFEYKPSTGLLRIFIYNTTENQPWQKQLHESQGSTKGEPSWTLRIEGKFVSDNEEESLSNNKSEELKFSSFLSAISVDLIANDDYPNLKESQSHIVEWRDDGSSSNRNPSHSFDGLDIKRPGVHNLQAKIALLVKSYSSKLRLSEEMARFFGKQESNQQELMYVIWQYVLYKNLFKRTSVYMNVPAVETGMLPTDNKDGIVDDDLSLVECDEILFELLKVKVFKFSDLYKLIQPHFRPREPIILTYDIDTRQSTTLGNIVLDVPIELPVNLSKAQKELLDINKSSFENLAKSDQAIQKLNQKISLGIIALQNANLRQKFYKELSENPSKFIDQWLESQSETLKALKSDEGYNEENVRRAEFFVENENLIKEKIDLMFGASKF